MRIPPTSIPRPGRVPPFQPSLSRHRCRAHHTRALSDASEASGPNYETMKTFENFIGGKWVPPVSGEYFENQNPADARDTIGRFPMSGAADVDAAVESAQRGFELWRRTPAPARGDVLRRVGDLLSARKDDDRRPDDARDGEAARRDARRRAGRDRHGVLRRERGTPPVRPHRAERAAQQVGDELPPSDRHRRHRHAVQLSARHSDVEDVPGARVRKRVRLQARRRRAAHRARARRDPARGRDCRPKSSSSCTASAKRRARPS